MTPQGLTILGATGTIGVNTLDVVSRHPQQFRVVALTGQSQLDKLAEQCRRFAPRYAVVLDAASASTLSGLLAAAGCDTEVLYGAEALAQVATLPEVDAVMAAIVGAAGLPPTLAAVRAGKRVLLANKESLVMAGELFMGEVRASHETAHRWRSARCARRRQQPNRRDSRPAATGKSHCARCQSAAARCHWRAPRP